MELEFFFKKIVIVGFHEKVFEWLFANQFLSNSKNISIFFYTNVAVFSTNEVFEHFIMKKDPFNQIIKKWSPKCVLVDLLEKHLGINVGF